MAVIDKISGLEVTVMVDGQPLKEYDNTDADEDTEKKVVRYVVAEPGKDFAVLVAWKNGCKYGPPEFDLNARLYIDGKRAKSRLILKQRMPPGTMLLDSTDIHLGNDNWVKRNFMFSDLVFDDNEAPPTSTRDIKSAKELGQIRVNFKRGYVGEDMPATGDSVEFKGGEKIHEKALKGRAMSRKAGLGVAQPSFAPRMSMWTDYDPAPFAEYVFRYRSMRDLKAEMIIPRSPSPDPEADPDEADLSPEELRAALLREKAKNAQIKSELRARIKREKSAQNPGSAEDDDEDGVEVITPPPKRQKVIENIDLTND